MANSNFRTIKLDQLEGAASSRNYISNGSARQNTSGWVTYADAAGTAPVDGTGGSPSITFTRTTSSPLSLDASFLFTKDAVNRQGQGVSYDFTIDNADRAKVMSINFDYEVASGTYADGDLTVWLYDITNAQVIQPSASSILNAIGPQQKQTASFQTNSNSTSYRLIIHVTSASASAYTVKFDNVSVTRESISQGTVVTDWVSYTPTTAGLGAVSSIVFSWRRVGDSVEILGRLNTGTPTATFATISLPSGLIADTAKISSSGQVVGSVIVNTSITSVGWYLFGTGSSSNLNIGIRATTTTSGFAYANGNAISNSSGDTISFIATVPILGWSSSQQLSSDADTRVVAARYSTAAGQSISTGTITIIDYGTMSFDTHGAVTTGASWKYTAKVPGKYNVKAAAILDASASWSVGEDMLFMLYKNGVHVSYLDYATAYGTTSVLYFLNGSDEIDLIAGDYIDIRIQQGSGATIALGNFATGNYVAIERISGPAQIAASDKILARYTTGAGQSMANGSSTLIDFGTKSIDTTGSVTTGASWKFTAPSPGSFEVNSLTVLASGGGWAAGEEAYLDVYKNGSFIRRLDYYTSDSTHTSRVTLRGIDTIDLIAGDYIDIRLYQGSGAAIALLNSGDYNYVTIKRVN